MRGARRSGGLWRRAMRGWSESAAGIDAAPGMVRPNASTADVIVDAVPIVMQCPGDDAIRSSIAAQSSSVISPARSSSQYFHTSEPEPRSPPPATPAASARPARR